MEGKVDHNKRIFDIIRLLRKNGRMKAREIAKELEFKNNRSISKYKKSIEKLGYEIKTTGGYYGGYELVETRLNDLEIEKLKVKLRDDYPLFEKILKINNKI